MFELEPGLIIWTCVSFAILVALLYKVLLPPLFKAIEQREGQIRLSLDQAKKAHEDADAMIQEYKKKMEDAHQTARMVVENSRTEASRLIKEAGDRAKHEAQLIIDQSRLEIASEKRKMMEDLRETGADIIVAATQKILEREVKKEDNIKTISESLDEIAKV